MTDKGLFGEDFEGFFTSDDLGLVLIRPAPTEAGEQPARSPRAGCASGWRRSSGR